MQSQLLRELSSERTPRNTFGHRYDPYRLPLREIGDTMNPLSFTSSIIDDFRDTRPRKCHPPRPRSRPSSSIAPCSFEDEDDDEGRGRI